ncbi:MAG: hypothetical protein QM817_11685 [Archangium sp.]
MRARLRRNGETNPVTWIVVILLAAAGFYIFHVGPVYMGNLEMKEAASEAFNYYWTNGEDAARSKLLNRMNVINADTLHLEVDEDGVEAWKPGYGITEEMVTFIENEKKLTVRVEYDRWVEFKPLKKRKKFHLIAEKTGTRLQ